jgi:hypothetical protein
MSEVNSYRRKQEFEHQDSMQYSQRGEGFPNQSDTQKNGGASEKTDLKKTMAPD